MIRIEDWWVAIKGEDDGYMAPEQVKKCLAGIVYNHPRRPDGDHVYTSSIVKVDGRIVTTSSGNIYCLGTPSEKYKSWCLEQHMVIDPANPIPIKASRTNGPQ